MKPDPIAMKNSLKKREAELQNLIRQMKQDNLNNSTVFKNLEQELENIKTSITSTKDQ